MLEFNSILQEFTAINLEEMDSVKLMDRMDTKYIFKKSRLSILLPELLNDYRILDVNGHRISRYESLYFDTPKFDLYRKHQCGKLNRYKIRFRKYVESDLNFFEVKLKNNKSRTIKSRVREKQIDGQIQQNAEALLIEKSPFTSEDLEAKLWVNYSRITFVNKNSPERVTLDINLIFKDDKQQKEIENIVIAEVKQDKSASSAFMKLMKKNHIRKGSISKYCLGVIHLIEKIKFNNFKPSLLTLNKTLYGTTSRT